jgi:mannose-6-phosphate isomerase-like protein (cupin superfamily)
MADRRETMEKRVKVWDIAESDKHVKPVENYPPGRANIDLVKDDVSENMLIVLQHLKPGHMGKYHYHKKCENVFVVLQGEMETIVGGVRRFVKAGQVIFMPSEVPHTIGNRGPGDVLGLEIYSPPRGTDSFPAELPAEIKDE